MGVVVTVYVDVMVEVEVTRLVDDDVAVGVKVVTISGGMVKGVVVTVYFCNDVMVRVEVIKSGGVVKGVFVTLYVCNDVIVEVEVTESVSDGVVVETRLVVVGTDPAVGLK